MVVRLDASGEMDFPGIEKQEVAWRGKLELDSKRELVSFELTAKFAEPRLDIGLVFDPLTYEPAIQDQRKWKHSNRFR